MKERKKGAVWDWFLRIADSRYQILGAPTTHSSELRATQLKQRGMKRGKLPRPDNDDRGRGGSLPVVAASRLPLIQNSS